jgi:hypothetical protein
MIWRLLHRSIPSAGTGTRGHRTVSYSARVPLVKRRLAAAAAALVVLAGVSACTDSPGAGPTPSPAAARTLTPSAAETLTLALALGKGLDCDITVTQPGQDSIATGSVNYGTQSATITSKARSGDTIISITATQVGPKLWAKIDFGPANAHVGLNPKKWYVIDQSKLTGANAKLFDVANFDVLDIAGLMASTSGLARKDATHITGTVDLTQSTGVSAPTADELRKAGPGATKIPFTATVDDQGRLVDLLIQANAADPDLTNEYAFSAFGASGAITAPPAADVATAPTAVYTIFNSL